MSRAYMVTALFALLPLTGCAAAQPAPRASTPAPVAQPAATAARSAPTPAPDASRAYAVVTGAGRIFVLLGRAAPAVTPRERLVIAGGWTLSVADLGAADSSSFTLVSPSDRCIGTAARNVAIRLDLGGYAGARMPSAPERAVEISGCGPLASDDSLVIALQGRDASAHWIHPAHLDDAPAPADRRLGENEVWLHRWLLPDSDVEIVERSVLRFVTPSCSEEQHDTIVVDEGDHPLSEHRDFALRGAIGRQSGPLLVLVGRDDASLRVVEADAAAEVVLDANLEVFEDTEPHGC
jgi:hypothetical protein